MRLQNKVAIVTGAGTGIGEAIAHRFAREGARLVLSGLPTDPVQDVAEAITNAGGQAVTYLGDLAEALCAQACVERALQTFGLLDILVSNAGFSSPTPRPRIIASRISIAPSETMFVRHF